MVFYTSTLTDCKLTVAITRCGDITVVVDCYILLNKAITAAVVVEALPYHLADLPSAYPPLGL